MEISKYSDVHLNNAKIPVLRVKLLFSDSNFLLTNTSATSNGMQFISVHSNLISEEAKAKAVEYHTAKGIDVDITGFENKIAQIVLSEYDILKIQLFNFVENCWDTLTTKLDRVRITSKTKKTPNGEDLEIITVWFQSRESSEMNEYMPLKGESQLSRDIRSLIS